MGCDQNDLAFSLFCHLKAVLELIRSEAERCTDTDLQEQIAIQGKLLTLTDCGRRYLDELQGICESGQGRAT